MAKIVSFHVPSQQIAFTACETGSARFTVSCASEAQGLRFLELLSHFVNHEQSSHPWDSHHRRMNSGTETWDVLTFFCLYHERHLQGEWEKENFHQSRPSRKAGRNCIRLLLLINKAKAGSAERARSDEPSSKRRCRSGCMITTLCKRPSCCHRQHLDEWIHSPSSYPIDTSELLPLLLTHCFQDVNPMENHNYDVLERTVLGCLLLCFAARWVGTESPSSRQRCRRSRNLPKNSFASQFASRDFAARTFQSLIDRLRKWKWK